MPEESTLETGEEDIEATFLWFAENILGLSLYWWQADAVTSFDNLLVEMVLTSVATPNESGKSSLLIPTLVLGLLALYDNAKVVMTTADGKQLDEQVMPAINRHRAKFPDWKFIERQVITPGPNGSRFFGFSTDDPGKAEGFQPNQDGPLLIIVDEAKSVPDKIFQAIDRCGYDGLLLVSSPGKMNGQFYDSQFKPELGYNVINVGLKDCPHIKQSKIDRIITKYGPNSPFTRSSLYGEFIEIYDGNPVYYAYNMAAQEQEELPWLYGATIVIGLDAGTRNASVITGVIEDKNGHTFIYVYREIFLTGSDTDRQAVELLRVLAEEFPFWNSQSPACPNFLFFCDPAFKSSSFTKRGSGSSPMAVLHSHKIYPSYKHGLHLQPSIAVVNRILQQHHMVEVVDFKTQERTWRPVWHFQINKNMCPMLCDGFRGRYRYPAEGEPGFSKDNDEPLKGDMVRGVDHVCFVAGTPVLTAHGNVPIESLIAGDLVFTRRGLRRVLATHARSADTVAIEVRGAVRARCTPDHPFWSSTLGRMKRIDEWTHYDTVFECNRVLKLLSGMGKLIAGILTRSAEATGFISKILRDTFITPSGNFTMVRDRRECTFITKMRIQAIMTFGILNYSLQRSTSGRFIIPQRSAGSELLTALELGPSQKRGTLQRREENGTQRMLPGPDSERLSTSIESATNAEEHTSPALPLENWSPCASAQTTANLRGAAKLAWTMWIAFASFAARRFGRINTKGRKPAGARVEESSGELRTVHALSVEGDHEYFAAGILVSNCDALRYALNGVMAIAEEAHSESETAKYPASPNPEPKRMI